MLFKYLNDSSNILLVGKVNVDEESVKVTGENNNLREIGKKVSDRYFCYGEAVGIIRFSRKGFAVLKENLKRKVAEGNCKVEWEGILNELSEKIDIEIIDIEDIKWIEIDKSVIIKMVDIFEKTRLDPRDAIHIASMKELGLSVIVSEDEDFDKVEGIERLKASKCIEKYI